MYFCFLYFLQCKAVNLALLIFCFFPSLSRILKIFLEPFISELSGEKAADTNTSAVSLQLLKDPAFHPRAVAVFQHDSRSTDAQQS